MTPLQPLRDRVARFGGEMQRVGQIVGRSVRSTPQMRAADFRDQLGVVALSALPLVGLAAFFVGMVIALNASMELGKLGLAHMVPNSVGLLVVPELAPVFTALLMSGKAGAGLASELGMITLSGQAQAMRALSLDIDRELLAPRIWACVVGNVLLTTAAMFFGLFGGMLIGAAKLGVTPVYYLNRTVLALDPLHFGQGLIKAAGFGLIIATIGCLYGLKDKADAGVLGRHTMSAVVAASFLVLICDHVFTVFIVAIFA